jgi:hypothetical protein
MAASAASDSVTVVAALDVDELAFDVEVGLESVELGVG